MADTFKDGIGAVPSCQFANAGDARIRCPELRQVYYFIRAELPRHFKPMCRAANNDGERSAGGFCDRQGGDSYRTRALDDYVFGKLDFAAPFDRNSILASQSRAFHAMNRRDQRATSPNHAFGREIIGNPKNIRARSQIMNLRIAAQKMRRLIALIPNPISAPLRAASRLTLFDAVITFAARRG